MYEWELFEDGEISDFNIDISINSTDDSSLQDHVINSKERKLTKKLYKRTALGKLKRKINRRVNCIPRVFKRDIRRSYALMCSNVVNTLNPNLMMKFLSTYCLPSIQLVKFSGAMAVGKQEGLVLSGLNEVHRFFTENSTKHPDYVLRIVNSKVIPDIFTQTSKIIIHTKISYSTYQNAMICYACGCMHNLGGGCSKYVEINSKPSVNIPELPDFTLWYSNLDKSHWNNISIEVFQILNLDDQNRIVSMELCPISLSSTPLHI